MGSAANRQNPTPIDIRTLIAPTANPPVQAARTEQVSPTSAELRRFNERRRAQELGYELPLNTKEAANYIGFHPKSVERWARLGEVPAHPASGNRRKTWKYYASELDEWLRGKVNSRRYPCSPNGKDSGH